MYKKCMLAVLLLTASSLLFAQQTPIKNYGGTIIGQVQMVSNYGELNTAGSSDKVFVVSPLLLGSGYYYLKALGNRQLGSKMQLIVNGVPIDIVYGTANGWQWLGSSVAPIKLQMGKNEIRFRGQSTDVPMVEEIYLTTTNPWTRQSGTETPAADAFISKAALMAQQPAGTFHSAAEIGDQTNKVLPNPEGIAEHFIDTTFTYSHFSWIYLTVGSHTFTTSGSTIDRSLTVFNPTNFTYSWSNVNSGPGGESGLYLYVGLAGYYAVMLRPVTDGQTGSTTILYNGTVLVNNAVIGGRRIPMHSLRGGVMNNFTCKLTGTNPDTRMIATRYSASSARGYNDDYTGSGSWVWGRASRISKDFSGSDSIQYGFVCAYSPTTTGTCDIYMGTGNSNLHDAEPAHFPLLYNDDALLTAPSSGWYNCIAWSGGVTTSWIWPPSSLSTYSCTSANIVQCFDNYYSNNPVRYPGAWNYTRTGATASNSVVDLWKQPNGGPYEHASVRKPGNNHPHGYDWESKPGGLCRTLHPRYALQMDTWYGVVNDYYTPTGTYARNAQPYAFATDADAIKAGVAIYDKGVLTSAAQEKLGRLSQKTGLSFKNDFEALYKQWDATKAANASMSNPSAYCQNKEYKQLEALALKHPQEAMVMVFDKFVNSNDHFIGDLLVLLTKEKYGRLLDEVKAERIAKPHDEQGRYRVHGDHDNGVLYIEKILKEFELTDIVPVATETVHITASPNPVKDILQLRFELKEAKQVTIMMTSSQTLRTKLIQPARMMEAGTHQLTVPVAGVAGTTGDLLSVQVIINGETQTVKVLVSK